MTSKIKRVSSFNASKLLNYPQLSHLSQKVQRSQGEDGKKTSMYFVIPPGDTKASCLSRSFGEVFQMAEAHFLVVRWIKDEECKDVVLDHDGNVFVFETFQSSGFRFLTKKPHGIPYSTEIMGHQVLRYIFTSPEILSFTTRSIPTFTLSMRNMVICLSGFKEPLKNELENYVRWMNGTLTNCLTKAVTHVVTTSALSDKCIEAHKTRIPVMTAAWVTQVWKDNQTNLVDATDGRYVKHSCPIFYNINISMSQISSSRKGALKAAIEHHGGICTAELIRGKTNVLVLTVPEGDKFKFASKWKLPCVFPEWIEHSKDQGYLLPTANFQVSNGNTRQMLTSTPAHSIAQNFDLDNTGCSAIHEPSRLVINETNETINFHMDDKTRTNELIAELKAIKNTGYLDGCRIYVVDHDKVDDLKRTFNLAGAVRLDQLSEGVTHVIVIGKTIPKSIQARLLDLSSVPALVTAEWVLQSAQNGSPADDELFKFETNDTYTPSNASSFVGSERMPPSSCSGYITTRGTEDTRNDTNVSTSISRTATSTSTHQGGDTTSQDNDDSNNSGTTSTSASCASVRESQIRSSVDNAVNEEFSPGLFVGTTFYVKNDDKEEYEHIVGVILEHGGQIKDRNADVAILPSVCSKTDKDKGDKSYTKDWLFDSLEQNSLDLTDCYYYIPRVSFPRMTDVLIGTVCAISQYPSNERAYLIDLIKSLGGIYQEVFTRTVKLGNLQSTHLICKNMDTEKAKAGKRWKVNVVVADWVLDSFRERKRLREASYDPANISTLSDDQTVFMPTPIRSGNTANASIPTFPPSTSKPNPVVKVKQNAPTAKDPEPVKKGQSTVPEPKSGLSKQQTKDEFQIPRPPHTVQSSTGSNERNDNLPRTNLELEEAAGPVDELPSDSEEEEDSFLRNLPPDPSPGEIQRKKAEIRKMFPYSDESYERLKEEVLGRVGDLNNISPFTSFEERRMANLDSSSPLIRGLTRQESRAYKEQFEIAMSRSPGFPKLKFKPPATTPLSEMVRRFNEATKTPSSEGSDSQQEASPRTSTPKRSSVEEKLRKTFPRFSFGNDSETQNEDNKNKDEEDQNRSGEEDFLPGIRKLSKPTDIKKRASDGSPDREVVKDSKRARKLSSSEEEQCETGTVNENTKKTFNSPNENVTPKETVVDTEIPSTSKKPTRMQELTNLVAETDANHPELKESVSPIKRNSAGDAPEIIPCGDETNEEVERPHLSWVDDEEEKSTVKRNVGKSRIPPKPVVEDVPPPVVAEPVPSKRSSRLRRTPSDVSDSVSTAAVGRRTRSQSKTRSNVPHGHQQPTVAKLSTKKAKGKNQNKLFPLELPPNPVFVLSSLNAEDRNQATRIITKLGGSISKHPQYDSNCNALISNTLLRSEKVLGCIAAGKVILKYEYLVKCTLEEQFIPIDETFIWNENNINQEKERELAVAAFGWLKAQLVDNTVKPMSGMKFCFVNQPADRLAAYLRLVEAGGGEVVSDLEKATDVISNEDLSIPEGVKLSNPLYLNTIILSKPPVE